MAADVSVSVSVSRSFVVVLVCIREHVGLHGNKVRVHECSKWLTGHRTNVLCSQEE